MAPDAPTTSARQARAFIRDERDSAALYDALAAAERDERLAAVYRRLAAAERRHADHWIAHLAKLGVPAPAHRVGWRTAVLRYLVKTTGSRAVAAIVASQEISDAARYANTADRAPLMDADEREHARALRAIVGDAGAEGPFLARLEGRHRSTAGNALRAAVLGANDGLLSNFSLVMGVAGANLSGRDILITGVAGLLAGAGSMALGEWLSVQSSRELYEKQIDVERGELAANPAEEAEELALIYQAKGLPESEARRVADRLMASEATALDTLTREELGIDPDELGGSAVQAAVTSFLLFAAGAMVPILPFIVWSGDDAILAAIAASTAGLFGIGAAITVLTGRSVWFSGTRQVLVGLLAAALTFGLGRLIGVSLS